MAQNQPRAGLSEFEALIQADTRPQFLCSQQQDNRAVVHELNFGSSEVTQLMHARCVKRVLILLLVALTISQTTELARYASWGIALAEVPNYQWRFLSSDERAVVEKSISFITSQRMQNVSLRILDDAGLPYTGTLQVRQDSTSFIFMVGGQWHLTAKGWVLSEEYFNFTPSRSFCVWAAWKVVESTKGFFDFSGVDYDYRLGTDHGMTDFHVEVGPLLWGGEMETWNTLPEWARSLDFDSLKPYMMKYVEALVSHFRGKVQNYHLWPEANAHYTNGNWPMDRVIDIMKMEAFTIRRIDPRAKIYVDLDNITPASLKLGVAGFRGTNSWTTEDFVEHLLSEGVPFDVIGLEPHYGAGEAFRAGGMDTLYRRLIELTGFGKPIYIWEDGPASFIEPQYLTDRGWWAPEYLWHGVPTEEKQAEYMVAETIIALGNPSVIGLRFPWLYDSANDLIFYHRFNGVAYDNGTRKRSYGALAVLWSGLKTNVTTYSTNGGAVFRGLLGDYTIGVEGYQPVKIRAEEGASNPTFTILLRRERTAEYTDALTIVASARNALVNLNSSNLQSPEAKTLAQQANRECELAIASLNKWDLNAAKSHAELSRQLAYQALQAEVQYRQSQREALEVLERQREMFSYALVGAVSALLAGIVVVYVVRKRATRFA